MALSVEIVIKDDGTVELVENFSQEKESIKRVFKGKSRAEILSDYTIIDIETTGYYTYFDEIIELAAIKIRNNMEYSVYNSLIKPQFEIPPFITELTGITNEMVASAPTIEKILPDFLDFIGNDIVIGHNVNFDVNFIYDHSIKISEEPFKNDFIDTMRLTRKLFADLPNHKLATIAKHFKLTNSPAHRSVADCKATLDLYRLIANYIEENNLNLKDLFKPKTYRYQRPSQITTSNDDFNEDHILFGKNCVFTGALEQMSRRNAMQLVVDLGGNCGDTVTKKTNYLILGSLEYSRNAKDGQSTKLKKAQSLILAGNDLEIISENAFYSLISDN